MHTHTVLDGPKYTWVHPFGSISLIPSHIFEVYSTVFQQDVPKHSTNYVFSPHLIYSSLLSTIRSFFNTRLLPSSPSPSCPVIYYFFLLILIPPLSVTIVHSVVGPISIFLQYRLKRHTTANRPKTPHRADTAHMSEHARLQLVWLLWKCCVYSPQS